MGIFMLFHIEPSNGLAIYDQIVRQVKFAVAGGALKPGEMMPSVRELARDLAINPNTIARAYRALRDDRVIDPVRGTGLEVAAGAWEQCRAERLKLIRERIRQVLIEAKQSRLEIREVRALIEKELADLERDKG
jgi:GntR family transcriptional regulator